MADRDKLTAGLPRRFALNLAQGTAAVEEFQPLPFVQGNSLRFRDQAELIDEIDVPGIVMNLRPLYVRS